MVPATEGLSIQFLSAGKNPICNIFWEKGQHFLAQSQSVYESLKNANLKNELASCWESKVAARVDKNKRTLLHCCYTATSAAAGRPPPL